MRLAITPVLALVSLTPLMAQETTATAIPHLVRFMGAFHPANGLPVGPTESATLSVYAEEHGGTPLWQETQNVALDADGQYTAVLGATQNGGVPLDLFTANSPRWLGVMFNRPGEIEQPRAQLVSVPYAIRAADAETLGGLPASAYLLDPNAAPAGNANSGTTTSASSGSAKSLKPRTISGNMNYIPYFTDNSNDLGNSVLYQSGSYVGIGTTGPARKLDVVDGSSAFQTRFSTGLNGGGIGADSNGFFRVVGAIGGALGTGNISQGTFAEVMRIWNGNVGIGTAGPARKLDVVDGSSNFQTRFSTGSNEAGIGADPNGFFRIVGTIGGALGTGSVSRGTFAEVMRIWNGNVGIGTTGPGSKLDVAGDINFSGIIRYQGIPAQQFSLTNTASGFSALADISTGANNTAVGSQALNGDTTGSSNTGIGYFALLNNSTGGQNTAVGAQSLQDSTGSGNTAIGWGALENNMAGNGNIAIGLAAGSAITGSNNIDIGNSGAGGDSGAIRIGTSGTQTSLYLAGVTSSALANQATLVLDTATGQVGYTSSSRRYKEDIQDMGDASSGLMRLRPVTFRYKQPANDGSTPIQYGLIAEEVGEVYPDLVAHSADGQIETVKYQVLDSMLLNEVQKQGRQIGQQQEQIQRLEEQNHALQERLEKLEAAIAGSR